MVGSTQRCSYFIGTRFVPFKTPLDSKFDANVPKSLYWKPETILAKFPEIKLIINLTKTDRYYDSTLFKGEVACAKIPMSG